MHGQVKKKATAEIPDEHIHVHVCIVPQVNTAVTATAHILTLYRCSFINSTTHKSALNSKFV